MAQSGPATPEKQQKLLATVRQWAAKLAGAVEAKRGGDAATELSRAPTRPSRPLPAQDLLAAVKGHVLSEVAYFECEAAQASSPSKQLRYLLCGFDAFQSIHTAVRRAGPVGWDTAVLVTMVQRIRKVSLLPGALASDAAEDSSGTGNGEQQQQQAAEDSDVLGTIVRTWRRLFVTLKDLDPDEANNRSRRRGALAVLNGLLSILLTHNNLHQVRIIVRSVDELEAAAAADGTGGVLGPCGHMGAEVVRFRYYRGRLQLYDRDPLGAFAHFRDAFAKLPQVGFEHAPQVKLNKRRVAFYWAVAGIAVGLQPPAEVLAVDETASAIAKALTTAINSGSDAAFDAALEYLAPVLKLRGVYGLLLANARPLCLLTRLKLVHAGISASGGDASRVPLQLLHDAEAATEAGGASKAADEAAEKEAKKRTREAGSGDAMDRALSGASYLPSHRAERSELLAGVRVVLDPVDELGLRVAQLISAGRVKGYVATEARTIVLSKLAPFPAPVVPA